MNKQISQPNPNKNQQWSDPRIFRVLALLLVFAVIAAVVFIFVKTLVFDRPLNDRALQQALIAAGIGISVVCLIAWFLDLLQILDLRPGWSKLLWGVLVVSMLGNSALIYKRFALRSQQLAASCFRLLETSSDEPIRHPYTVRKNSNYLKNELVGYFVSLRGAQTDENGNYSIDIRTSFEDRSRGISLFNDLHWSGNAAKLKQDVERKKRLVELKAAAPECVDEETIFVAQSIRFTAYDFSPGIYTLTVVAIDTNASAVAMAQSPIQLLPAK